MGFLLIQNPHRSHPACSQPVFQTDGMSLNSTTNLNAIDISLIENAPKEYANSLLIVSAITLLLYDILLNIDAERTFIWNIKWSAINGVYFVVRYLSLFLHIYNAITIYASTSGIVCSVYVWLEGFGGFTLEAAAEILIIHRVAAFGGNKKRLIVVLGILYVAVNITTFVLAGNFLSEFTTTINPVISLRPVSGNCIVFSSRASKSTLLWEVILAYQSLLFACLLFQVVKKYRQTLNVMGSSRLQTVFIRDGVWAYSALLVNLLLCVIFTYKAQNFVSSIITWLWTTISICCCRLILNLRSTAHERRDFGISQASQANDTSMTLEFSNSGIPLVQFGTKHNTVVEC